MIVLIVMIVMMSIWSLRDEKRALGASPGRRLQTDWLAGCTFMMMRMPYYKHHHHDMKIS